MFVVIYFVIGVIISLSLYNFLLFLSRKHNYSILAFTFYGIIFICGLFIRHVDLMYYFYTIKLKITLFALIRILEGLNFVFFSHTIFNLKTIKQKNIIFVMLLIIVGGILIGGYNIFYNFVFIQLTYILVSVYTIVFTILAFNTIIKKKQYRTITEKIKITGYLTFFILTSLYMFFNTIRYDLPFLYYSAYILLGCVFTYSLIDNFNREYKNLLELNTEMENKIKQRTRQLELANQEIEKASSQKINVFINFAHETKTPVTIIANYLDKDIKKRGLSDELKIVRQNIDKINRNMTNFLDLEKLDRNQNFYDHDIIINVSTFLHNKALMFKEVAKKKNIKIFTEITDEIYTRIDPYAIDRIVNNLFDNAIKYTLYNGVINAGLEADNDFLTVMISDTGIGISQEQIANIFNPYHQISHEKRNIQGIGMGLSIIHKIIDDVNGTIRVDSELNKGTAFTIRFKRYALTDSDIVYDHFEYTETIDSVSEVTIPEPSYKEGRKHILLVEDNVEMLSFLISSMEEEYNVFYAVNGKDALDKIEELPIPDIIISDIMMDIMDGYEFRERLRESERYMSIPFIFLTAKTSLDEKIKGLKKGAVDFINKPFLIDELLEKIRSMIKLQQAQDEAIYKELTKDLIQGIRDKRAEKRYSNELNREELYKKYKITDDEIKLIELMNKGMTYFEIGDALFYSEKTIRNKVHNIYKKCGVHKKSELFEILNFTND